MASLPTATDVRLMSEGYCIDTSTLSDAWINARISGTVIPIVENITKLSFSGIQQVTEYYSGNGQNTLALRRRNFLALIKIEYVVAGDNFRVLNLTNVETVNKEGLIKAKRNVIEAWLMPIFPKGDKNLKITYTYGYDTSNIPADIAEAIIYLAFDTCLMLIEGRSGGGDVSVEGYSKSFGNRGKYTNLRRDIVRLAFGLLGKYITRI